MAETIERDESGGPEGAEAEKTPGRPAVSTAVDPHPTRDESGSGLFQHPTCSAPPFRPPVENPAPVPPNTVASAPPAVPPDHGRVEDFEMIRELGVGGFGRVFLARQLSLGRLVAVKMSANRGQEARTLARLEHAHIVRIFSEIVDPHKDLRILCMQYVPGTNLQRIIEKLSHRDRQTWSGHAILEILDSVAVEAVPLDPAALRERELLARCDFVEAVCTLGARLAEALAHAHALGVLHRDVKPANVLIDRYGRPFLADFNVSTRSSEEAHDPNHIGGTLLYMAPEHLEAFCEETPATPVDERSDIYSLGLVLWEMLVGKLPFKNVDRCSTVREFVRKSAEVRKSIRPELPAESSIPRPVECLLRRCLEPVPSKRYPTASDLGRALDGCRELRHMEKHMPPEGPLTRGLRRWPFALGCMLMVLPHIIGTVVNISYNALQIVENLTPEQRVVFPRLVMFYNSAIYPVCIALMIALILPGRRIRLRLVKGDPPEPEAVAHARRNLLRLPLWSVALSCLGWLPGAFFFPFGLNTFAGPIGADVFGHFLISFLISGLIALTYSFFVIEFVVVAVLYPMLWTDASDVRALAHAELSSQDTRLAWFQVFAVLIPLMAAVMLVVGPETVISQTFRFMIVALIVLGMVGLGVAMQVSRRLREVIQALTGGEG